MTAASGLPGAAAFSLLRITEGTGNADPGPAAPRGLSPSIQRALS